MSENNEFNSNVYYDLDNDNKKDDNDFVNQERNSEHINIPHYESYNQPQQQENSGFAIASLVLGILSLVCCGSFLFSILAIVFYFVDKNNTGTPNKLAKIGMILGIVSLVLTVLFYIFYIAIIALGIMAEGGMPY